MTLCRAIPAGVVAVLLLVCSASADTTLIEGQMTTRVTLEIRQSYQPAPGTEWIAVQYPVPPSIESRTWRQRVVRFEQVPTVVPTRTTSAQDRFGNSFVTTRWDRPPARIDIVHRVVVDMVVDLAPLQSAAPFPAAPAGREFAPFLEATALVQRSHPRVVELARSLTAGAHTQREATTRILNYVVDHLRYRVEPPRHDALVALETGVANCQGYAHLAMALLRAAGIPARVASGISLDRPWMISRPEGGTLTLKQGKGRHAWIEIYFPDLGWLAHDAQTAHRFVSAYNIRHSIGRDVADGVEVVSAAPTLPAIQESVEASFSAESGGFRTLEILRSPRSYLVASRLLDRAMIAATPPPPVVIPPPPVVTPPPPVATPPPPVVAPPAPPVLPARAEFTKLTEFGNLDFPAALRIFGRSERGAGPREVRAARRFVVETAEYASGPEVFAQAFKLDQPFVLTQVSLALQKFGGARGDVWLDLLGDRGGQPGPKLAESRRLGIASIVAHGGYRWVLFDFGGADQGVMLPAGRYWVTLRNGGDGIFNWYFAPGNAYGEPDDTRSRTQTDWSNVLNYRFNFRITGLARP